MIGPSPSVAESLFADSIVVIGATHRASLDEVATPIGEMPGAFALVNVVRGLADFGIEEPFSFWQNLIAAVLLAFGTAVLMTIAKHSVSRWIEALLPFAILSLWLAFLVFGLGDNLYFTMALIPIIVGAVLLLLPEQRNDGFDRVRTAHKHKGKNR
jgi:CHASE2 domain-containing sensor protein